MQLFLSKSFFLLNISCTFAIEIKKHHKKKFHEYDIPPIKGNLYLG